MWRRTEELKPSSPGAEAAEPGATTANPNSTVTPPATISTSSVQAASAAAAFTPAAASAPDVAAAMSAVSTIGPGLKIRGDITGSCHLVIEGEANGKIHLTNGRVTVRASGRVNADIEAPEIEIDGNVQGNLHARDNVRMGPASHVQGSVLARRFRIEDGARFRGKVEMTRPGTAAETSGGKASTGTSPATSPATPAAAPTATAATSPADAVKPIKAIAVAPRG
jgi:cytoskeletal protein CcmA (bactofilin family)